MITAARGSSVQKSSGVKMNFNITTNSLDQCIARFQLGDYQTIKRLLLYAKEDGGNDIIPTFNQVLAILQHLPQLQHLAMEEQMVMHSIKVIILSELVVI
jgi:hypothetical protein